MWAKITQFIAFVAIPINIYIILLCGNDTIGQNEGTKSKTVDWLLSKDSELWNKYTICLFLFSLEHVIFIIMVIIEAYIPDVPANIKDENRKRAVIKENAKADLSLYKNNRRLDSLEDTIEKLK